MKRTKAGIFRKDSYNSNNDWAIDKVINYLEKKGYMVEYKDQEDLWDVAHSIGCADCKGTYYYSYGKSWSFLDTIFVSKQRNISYDADSIKLHITEHNAYKDSGKPIRFNAKSKTGVSDHLPMVARIKIN